MSGSYTALDNTDGGTGSLGSSGFNFTATNAISYSFTPGADTTWEIEGLRMGLRHATSPGNYTITVGLYLSSSGAPTGSALASATLSVSLSLTATYRYFTESNLGAVGDYTLVKGVTYALMFTAMAGVRWMFRSSPDTPPEPDSDFNYDGYRSRTNSSAAWSEPTNETTIELLATPTCFLRGTLILTERGEVPVEQLREGDLVAAQFGGLRPIRWIGTQSFHPRFAGPAATPVRFASGSLGDGVPSADLCVSPGHAMLVGTVLAHAGALVNGSTITQPAFRGESIDYFHLDLGPHDCVLANGAWAESYFEDRNRDSFHNAADFHARFPGHVAERQATCLQIIAAGHPAAEGLRRMLTPVALRQAA